jgi:translocation and assembly module TamB
MVNLSTRKSKLSFALTVTIIVISIIFFLLRGPYLSNYIKRMIIPVLENVSRERILIDKAVINLFPFYVQAKGFKVFDKDGNRLLWITKSRAYIDLVGLLSKEVRIRRLTLLEPDLTVGEDDLKRIIEHIRNTSSDGGEGEYTVSIKNIKLTDGNLKYGYKDGAPGIEGTGLFIDMMTKKSGSTINAMLKDAKLRLDNNAEIEGGMEAKLNIHNDKVTVAEIKINADKSSFNAKGHINMLADGRVENGSLTGKAEISVDTLNTLFALKEKKDGLLTFEGSVALQGDSKSHWPRFTLDLNTKSSFYLETLMEIVKVQETIKGSLSLDGNITGTFPDIIGKGKAKLEDAVFATLLINDLEGDMEYRNQKFSLTRFTAKTYGGSFSGKAHITIPDADYFISADLASVDSEQFFKFLGWDAPFKAGTLDGHLELDQPHDSEMIINADLQYTNKTGKGDDVFARVKTIFANLELRDNVLSLQDSILSSMKTSLLLNGYIDFNENTHHLDMLLNSENADDITAPDYSGFISPVRFIGKTAGPLDDPEIAGRLEAGPGSIQGMPFSSAFADLAYSIKSLNVEQMQIKQEKAEFNVKGNIAFKKSEELFTFIDPYFRAEALLKQVDIVPFITTAYRKIPVKGEADGVMHFSGDAVNYKVDSELNILGGEAYGQEFDVLTINSSLNPERIKINSIAGNNGDITLNAEGTLNFDGQYEVVLNSEGIRLADYPLFRDSHIDAAASLKVKGSGNINKPQLDYSIILTEGSYKDIDIDDGMIVGNLIDKELRAKGSFANAVITADAAMNIAKERRWSVDVQFHRGDYGFLLNGMIKNPPRDLSLSMKGDVSMKGEGSSVSADAAFDFLELNLYGYNFRNQDSIQMELRDNEYRVKSFMLYGDKANINVSGSMHVNKRYNLKVEGDMDIAPLRMLSESLSSVRGHGKYSLAMTGVWNNPQIDGKIDLQDTTAAFSDFAYKIGPMNGTIYFKKDRITFEGLTTEFAGGNIVSSGAGYFKNMKFTRLFVSSDMSGIKIRPAEGVSSEIGGQLFYEASPERSALTGDINLMKAKYDKDIDCNNWLLGLSDLKEEKTGYPDFLNETEMNIRIVSDNIIIDNNIAKTPLRMSLNVTGTVGEPGLVGRIEASEGTIFFRRNEFNILEGSSVDFIKPNRIEPVFHIIADTYAGDYYVKLAMDGTIDKFDLTMFSDPPLDETEILTLLTFGQIGKDASGFDSEMAAGEATAFLTGTLQDEVGEDFESLTGLERFEIEPHTTTAGAVSPKVTVGKSLLENKIVVTYSSAVGTIEEQMINVEYRLNENLSLVASRNEIGSAGVDFKYRFEFK